MVECFDSYGLPPLSAHFNSFIQKNSTSPFRYNSTPLQSFLIETCGKFVSTYLHHRCRGTSHENDVRMFEGVNPDRTVRKMYSNIFGSCACRKGKGRRCYRFAVHLFCTKNEATKGLVLFLCYRHMKIEEAEMAVALFDFKKKKK